MTVQNRYTFLGASDAALSMFIEILFSNLGKDFSVQIVENIEVDHHHEYLMPGIHQDIISDQDWKRSPTDKILIGVNKADNKRLVYDFFRKNHKIQFSDYSSLVHTQTAVASTVSFGHGIILNPGVTIAPFASLGHLVTLNRNVSIGHHTMISDLCTIHPGTNIAGHCQIGSGVTIGMGSNVVDGVSIGENSVIGAGSLVTKDIPSNVVAYGFPAKVVKHLS